MRVNFLRFLGISAVVFLSIFLTQSRRKLVFQIRVYRF